MPVSSEVPTLINEASWFSERVAFAFVAGCRFESIRS
jgi:hypothetical protein